MSTVHLFEDVRSSIALHANINAQKASVVLMWHIKYRPKSDDLNIAYAHEVDVTAL